MLKIGVIGLGNIAQKAYLPVYSQLQDQADWYLVSRNETKLQQIQKQYGFPQGTTNQDDLFQIGVDAVFIHTPTQTHYALIKKFLEQGINVFVDKPVSENIEEVHELYQLAAQQGVLLTCGFNRRFVPMHEQLKAMEQVHTVSGIKTRELEHQGPKFAIFDLLIHVIDTVQYLMGSEEVKFTSGQLVQKNGELVLARINLQKGAQLGTATVDMQAGMNAEAFQVISNTGINTVDNLRVLTTQKHGQKQIQTTPDWQVNLRTRGFEPLIKRFLEAVLNGQANPVSPASAILSHELCTRLIRDGKVIK